MSDRFSIFRSLALLAILFATSSFVNAGEFCSSPPFNGVVDGNIDYSTTTPALDPFPTQITIDTDCTFQNFPASNPLTATLNFQTNDPSVYLITFNNVIFTGNMACANIDHRIWFVNGSDYGSNNNCQDLFIPVEAINKTNPPGKTTVGIGEEFTYTLKIPVLYDPVTGTYIDNAGSANELHSITVQDDLNATGADLTLVGTPTVYWEGTTTPVAHTFTNNSGLLEFVIDPGVTIPAGDQIEIAITVVADNTNVAGTQFFNTATWSFGRLIDIDGVPTYFDPLPGENGVTAPMTIGGPDLTVTKSSPDTALNLVSSGTFTIDVQNTGGSTAFRSTIVDQLPAGMCDNDPTASVTARIYQADGTTPVSPALVSGVDYSVAYAGPATCTLTFNMLTDNTNIGSTERLIITYQTALDADVVDGSTHTNVAGATVWYSGDGSYPRTTYTKTLTDGTPTIVDYQDSHTVTASLSGYIFQKTVQNITSAQNPATVAAPGDTLRYRVRIFNFTEVINGVTITDNLDASRFDLSSFNMVTPPGAGTYAYNSTTGVLQIIGTPNLDLTPPQELVFEFDITLLSGLANGTLVSNQANLTANSGTTTSSSDDPFVNGVDDPLVNPPNPDPTTLIIQQPSALTKSTTAATASIGEEFTYTITVPETAVSIPLYDVRILDNLTASNADLTFVSASVLSGGSWTLSNTGTASSVVLQDTNTGIDIPANTQAVIQMTVRLSNTARNQQGVVFNNTANYTYNRTNGTVSTQTDGGSAVSGNTTVVEPHISALTKTVNNAAPNPGDTIRYTVTLTAGSGATYSDVYDVILTDNLALGLVYVGNPTVSAGSGASVDNMISAPDITGDGTTTAQTLIWGVTNSDIDIYPGETVTISYDVQVAATTYNNQTLNNAVYAQWSSVDGQHAGERTGIDGVGGLNDYQTAIASVSLDIPPLPLDKQNPAVTEAVVGLPFTYRIVVPATPQSTALYDVRILDDLTASAADLSFVSVTRVAGSQTWTPVNTGTSTNLVIEDTTNGIDIPAGEQITIDVTVVLDASATNVAGLFFTNTATYTFNRTNGDPASQANGLADTTANMTIVSPDFTFTKTVYNVTTSQPGTNASPGDVLRYTITATNLSSADIAEVSIFDEVDGLNTPPVFQPGSLTIISVPTGADSSNTDPNGGANGTGRLDVRNMSVTAAAGASPTVTIVFEVTLADVIDNGTVVENQAQLQLYSFTPSLSTLAQTTISSSPDLRVQKISDDITGLANDLQPGDTLRYTITVKNIGNENLVNATLRDLIPANTTYVANSTTLNGNAVADPSAGGSPLVSGIAINAPENTTPGYLRADPSTSTSNVATIVFSVTINASAVTGTIISNQGFVNGDHAGGGAVSEVPSDDPDTVIVNDPTRDIVGNLPLLDAQKTVTLVVDNGNLGVVDAGDRLRYTITITNYGTAPATDVNFIDAVPTNTTYVAGSTYLNTELVTDAGVGISPLIGGIPVSSNDLTPPLPTAGTGTVSVGSYATIVFDVIINAGVTAPTVISNQGTVSSYEQTDEPTDADGIDSNGDQPTLIAIGNAQQLSISKSVAVVNNSLALAGGQLEYTIVVTNVGLVPATDVVVNDNIDSPVVGQMDYVMGSGTINGSTTGITFSDPILTADYSTYYGNLAPGAVVTVRFRVDLSSTLNIGDIVTNTATVYWNAASQNASDSVAITIGAMPGVGVLEGMAWHDADFDNSFDAGEIVLPGWSVQLYRNNALIGTVTTDSSGMFLMTGVPANYVSGEQYTLRFVAPGAGPNTALLGQADSLFTNGLQSISDIIVYPSTLLQNLNLPIEPNGVVYNSVVRVPVAGATLTMRNASTNTALPSTCFDDSAQQNQVTTANGYYKFDINFTQAECPDGGDYLIDIAPPTTNFVAGISTIIPPTSSLTTAPFSVPGCLMSIDDAVPGTVNYCEVQAFETAPALAIPPGDPATKYHLHLTLDNGQIPGESQLFNNHIPVDPELGNAVTIRKTSSIVNVTRGDMVPYTITINNTLPVPLTDITITDTIPAGFKYVAGSARLDGTATEPVINGLQLNWQIPSIAIDTSYSIKLLLVVGSGVQEGEYINRAQVFSGLISGSNISEQATATVRVVPDPTFDCSDVIGKVFDDKNMNGRQDEGELGLQGVRVVTVNGLLIRTDKQGRFHITCAAIPDETRGSNFILKLDERTLPSGFRVTTENPRVERITRGKMIKFNFGATIHRVVRIDVADGVFESQKTTIRQQWLPRIDLLISELKKAPSVLRLTYLGDVETEDLAEARLEALHDLIEQRWDEDSAYRLDIEQEIFWRNGSPEGGGGFN